MNYLISKEQYRVLAEKILGSFFGKISAGSLYDDLGVKRRVIELLSQSGINFADIYLKSSSANKRGCKKLISLNIFEVEKLEKFAPIFRKKEFSKVMIDYVYKHTGIKCDCVEFEHSQKTEYDDEGEPISWNSKSYFYKKKKK